MRIPETLQRRLVCDRLLEMFGVLHRPVAVGRELAQQQPLLEEATGDSDCRTIDRRSPLSLFQTLANDVPYPVMRNVVLVTVDSLRADHVTPYADVSTTPELDALADDGVVYEHAIAPGPATPQSMPAIWTGSYPSSDGPEDAAESTRKHLSTRDTLAERFSRLGYTTAAITPNPFTSRYYGFDTGFDEFEDFLNRDSPLERLRSRVVHRWMEHGSALGGRFALNMFGLGDVSRSWESYYDRITSWAERSPEPWFLWVFSLEPHWPYRPPRRYRDSSLIKMYRANLRRAPATNTQPSPDDRETLLSLYRGTIRHVDELIGRLRADFDDSIVAVHGDHGEAFGEHGSWGHGSVGFGGMLFEENIHVPFVIGNVERDRVDTPISLRSLGDVLTASAVGEVDWHAHTAQWVVSRSSTVGIRGQTWKYVDTADGEQTYDLRADPGEHAPLPADHPLLEIGQRLKARFQESRDEAARLTRASEKLIDHSDGL